MSHITGLLAGQWGIEGARVEPLDGGMSSLTWSVEDKAGRRYAVKSVDAERYGRQFAEGLSAAARLSAAGIPAGAPVPTLSSALTVLDEGRVIALLDWVAGTPVEQGTPEGMATVGRTLARAHLALGAVPGRARIEPYLDPRDGHLDVRPWVRSAIERAREAVNALDVAGLTWGPLHGDPAAEAFLLQGDGTCGLIDWGAHMVGPRVFDLASAVMYAGGLEYGGPLIEAYLAEGGLGRDEVARALEPMLGWRWACQAWYFARRTATGEMTGIDDPSENEKGLADARAYLDPERSGQ